MPDSTDVARALKDGARRSRLACGRPMDEAVTVRIWNRHRWRLIGLALLIILELLGGLMAGGTRGHF